ncbi:MAG TPA: ABC transporter permease [Thermoanaerobaculia bacterium]|nr:ABC transporter permease [Thermoanaerobaculia bacterium]
MWSRLALRALLQLYPRAFRDRYGEEIAASLRECVVELGRTPFQRWRALALGAASVVRAALLERVDPSQRCAQQPLTSAGRPKNRGTTMDMLLQDLRHAARSLVRRPGFTVVAVLTLSLGLAACVAIFSVVHAVLLRQLPYPNAEQLVTLSRHEPHRDFTSTSLSQPDVRDLAAAPALERLVAHTTTSFTLTGGERPEVIPGAAVGDGLLGVFGVAPVLGRDLRSDEAVPDGPRVVVLSYAFWQERLGGDRAAIGRGLELDGRSFEVVGVAPPGFDFPGGASLWMPTDIDEEDCGRDCNLLKTVGRLRPDATLERAEGELEAIAARLREEYPEDSYGRHFRIEGLREQMVGSVRRGLLVLLGAVVCVLLVAIANVANLVLAQGAGRRDELTVRAALGASRARLLWLLALENALVAGVSGMLGTLAAVLGVRALLALAPPSIPRLDGVSVGGPVLLFALGLVAVTTVLFGLVPAWRLVGRRRSLTLRSRGAEESRAGARRVLLAAEVAVSLVLLLAAGVLLRSFQRLLEVELGFQPDRVTTFFVALPESRYDSPDKRAHFFEELESAIVAVPGVEAAGAILGAPLDRSSITTSIELLDRPAALAGQEESAALRVVTPGYFRTAGIPLLEGRLLSHVDRHGAPATAVVNRALAERHYPDGSVLGKQIGLGVDFGWAEESWTIVGVVGDVRSRGLTEDPPAEVYVAQGQIAAPWLTYLVRAAPGVEVLPAVEGAVAVLDPDLPLRRPETMNLWVERARGPALFFMTLIATFAVLALVLAAVGLYGVVAYVVSRRTHEIAIRMAVGADRRSILGLVLRQGGWPVLVGLALGLGGSLLAGRALRALLFEVAPHDAATVVAVTGLLVAVSVLAMLIPARRASRIAPAHALKAEG